MQTSRYIQLILALVIVAGAALSVVAIAQGWTTGLAYLGLIIVALGAFPFVARFDERRHPGGNHFPHPRS